MDINYQSYLKVDDLLELQFLSPEGPEHDELLFITIHQVYELWFKQLLHEFDLLQESLESASFSQSNHTLKRVRAILKTLVGQLDILETMTPISFESFRDRLQKASGFQSFQFRKLEFILGRRSRETYKLHNEEMCAELENCINRRSLYQSLLYGMKKFGHDIPETRLETGLLEPNKEHEALHPILVKEYREGGHYAGLMELFVDIDEGLQEWRYRHVKMAERTIGTKAGTGGSSGVEYLRRSLFQPIFPDLWAIRSLF